MPKARLDRTTVSLRRAVKWILLDDFDRPTEDLRLPQNLSADEIKAGESLLIALRDADLCATGRFSNSLAAPWEVPHLGRNWVMHSRWPTKIMCTEWQRGRYDWVTDALDLPDGQYIDIQVPRFMVEAIWPLDPKPLSQPIGEDRAERPYTTPYLDLMQRAITELGITAEQQPKKETVMEWFRQQEIDQRAPSENHIRHMATFVRRPDTQKGGNRKWNDAAAPSRRVTP